MPQDERTGKEPKLRRKLEKKRQRLLKKQRKLQKKLDAVEQKLRDVRSAAIKAPDKPKPKTKARKAKAVAKPKAKAALPAPHKAVTRAPRKRVPPPARPDSPVVDGETWNPDAGVEAADL